MADKDAKFPRGTIMRHPDGSQYIYLQTIEDLSDGMFVETNVLGSVVKWRGAVKFPKGICIETCPKNWWTFVMIQEAPQARRQEVPAIEMPNV